MSALSTSSPLDPVIAPKSQSLAPKANAALSPRGDVEAAVAQHGVCERVCATGGAHRCFALSARSRDQRSQPPEELARCSSGIGHALSDGYVPSGEANQRTDECVAEWRALCVSGAAPVTVVATYLRKYRIVRGRVTRAAVWSAHAPAGKSELASEARLPTSTRGPLMTVHKGKGQAKPCRC